MKNIKLLILLSIIAIYSYAFAKENYDLINTNNHIIYRYNFDTSKDKIELIKAQDTGHLALETVLDVAKRHKAKAAFNGGFFESLPKRLGIPSNFLVSGNLVYANTAERDCIYFGLDEKIYFAKLRSEITLNFPDGKNIVVQSLNSPQSDGIVIYTDNYWAKTLTNAGSLEIVVENGTVKNINKNGNSTIPSNGFVITALDSKSALKLINVKSGDKISYSLVFKDKKSELKPSEVLWLVSGSDIVIKNSKLLYNNIVGKNQNMFKNSRHARTSLCQISDTKYSVFVVDNNASEEAMEMSLRALATKLRQYGYTTDGILETPARQILEIYNKHTNNSGTSSYGMTMFEFAKFMSEQGCINAINLDGGSSSTLVVGREVVNFPLGVNNIVQEGKNVSQVSNVFIVK